MSNQTTANIKLTKAQAVLLHRVLLDSMDEIDQTQATCSTLELDGDMDALTALKDAVNEAHTQMVREERKARSAQKRSTWDAASGLLYLG